MNKGCDYCFIYSAKLLFELTTSPCLNSKMSKSAVNDVRPAVA